MKITADQFFRGRRPLINKLVIGEINTPDPFPFLRFKSAGAVRVKETTVTKSGGLLKNPIYTFQKPGS